MRIRRLTALALPAAVVACTGLADATPSTSVADGPGEPIVIGLSIPLFAQSPFFTISNAADSGPPNGRTSRIQLVYNGLYRYDDSLSPVPDLAAVPCDVSEDQVTITCRLVEATFHDGSQLTADDVAFTFEVGRREIPPGCLFAFGRCFGDILESATAVDERTVEFKLSRPDATFLTSCFRAS